MSQSIVQAHVRQFSGNMIMLSQQKGSRLRPTVMNDSIGGESAFYDRLAKTAAVKKTSRHQDTPRLDQEHSRRKLDLEDYVWADLIDTSDRIRMLVDPTSPYVQNGAWSMGRAMDDAIIAAATGTASTGKEGSGSAAFDADMAVAVNEGGGGNVGLTVEKLRAAKENLDAREVDDEDRNVVFDAKQCRNLLAQTEVTSSDYNTVKALVRGEIDTFMGFTFLRSERLLADANGDTQVLYYAKSALMLGVGQEPTIRVSERDDKNYSTQVYVEMGIGAVRLDEDKVGYIACDPS